MISQLTFTRFIAAFLIVFLHFGSELFVETPDFIKVIRENLHLGVSYFFVLSGYVMMIAYYNLEKIDFKSYIINRISRIYPTHLLSLFLVIVVGVVSSEHTYKFDKIGLALNTFLLQAWFPRHALSFNIPSWSISVELFFYICFPFLFNYFIKKTSSRMMLIVSLTFWLVMQLALNLYYHSDYFDPTRPIHKNFLFYNPIFNFSSFLIGCLARFIFKTKNYQDRNYDAIIIMLVFLTALCVFLFHNLLLQNGLLSINFSLIIIFLSLNNGYITQAFKNKTLIHLGDISFAMYLLQLPIFLTFNKINTFITIKNPYIYFIVGFLILLFCSHFVFKHFENPLRKRIKILFL